MIILSSDQTHAVNTDKVCYYKVCEAGNDYALRAYFENESVLLTKGARQYLLNLIRDIAEKSGAQNSYMEL